MTTERQNLMFLTLKRGSQHWEYVFTCPVCKRLVQMTAIDPPNNICCPKCAAQLDSSDARIEITPPFRR
jgi:hypothetical protein